jgi:hypothetical protein
MGIVAVGALAVGVGVLAAPRTTDDAARGPNRGKTEVTRLLTGDPAQINAVVAGSPPSAIIEINPVGAKTGSYPAGTGVSGNTLTTPGGTAFRGFFDVVLSNWDPNGDGSPILHTIQIRLDAAGYMGGLAVPANGSCDLAPPEIPCSDGVCTAGTCVGGSSAGLGCANNAACSANVICRTAFGETWAKCESAVCKQAYADASGNRADGWCTPGGTCFSADADTSSLNYGWFAVANDPNRPDEGTVYYAGSLVVDIPSCCKGKYTVNLDNATTFLADDGSTQFDTAQENGFVVDCVVGRCCFGLGGAAPGCVANVLKSECDALAQPSLWAAGVACPADGGPPCAECTLAGRNTDPLCNDGNACTDDDCGSCTTVVALSAMGGRSKVDLRATGNARLQFKGDLTGKSVGSLL